MRRAAAILGIIGLAVVGAACGGGGNGPSYHLGYTEGQSGVLLNETSADHYCHSLPTLPVNRGTHGVDNDQLVQGCLAGFKAAQH